MTKMAKMYAYTISRDYGFAPNPFHGVCTLCTCKPKIRKAAEVGDWVIGVGSKPMTLNEHLIYAMRVTETMSFDLYWSDPRFACKIPNLRGSLKQAYGDNIYHTDPNTGQWIQEDSHHSYEGGRVNRDNLNRDTKPPRVLISDDFIYFGENAPKIPSHLAGQFSRSIRNYKVNFSAELVRQFIHWIRSYNTHGCCGRPVHWSA